MPTSVVWPTIWVYTQSYSGEGLNKNQFPNSTKYTQNNGLSGGVDWWYYTTAAPLPASNPPAGYTHKWQFTSWSKNGGPDKYENVEEWRKGWGDLGYGPRLNINQIIERNENVELPAYNGETFYYYFFITQETAITYTCTVVPNNGINDNYTFNATFNTSVTVNASTTKLGHSFVHFTSNFGNIYSGVAFTWNRASNETLTSVWAINTYTITYNSNSGTGTTAQTSATYNNNINVASNGFTRTNYNFIGWGTNTTDVNTSYPPNSVITNPNTNLTLYAIWRIIQYTVTYSSTTNSITTITTATKDSGTILGIPPNDLLVLIGSFPTVFKGWYYNNQLITSITLTDNITLIALWETSNAIPFSLIQQTFGGKNPIYLSEYYLDDGYINRPGGIGIPTSGQISVSQIKNKYKSNYEHARYMSFFNGLGIANMNATNGISMTMNYFTADLPEYGDDDFASIGVVGFPFFWFGTDYGTTNNIQWCTNNVLTFGGGSTRYQAWNATEAAGVLMGQSDRKTVLALQFSSTTENGYNIKRFIVKQRNYYNDADTVPSAIEMEILLMRDTRYQYILIKIGNWNPSNTAGIWNISDKTEFKNIFNNSPPVGSGENVLLIGSLTGTNWISYNLPYLDAIRKLSANLVLHHDGYNINGANNYGMVVGNTISSWRNLANTTYTTTQATPTYRPTYTTNGVQFSNGKVLESTIIINESVSMNIFVVWKKTFNLDSTFTARYLWSTTISPANFSRSLCMLGGSTDDYLLNLSSSSAITYTFPLNITTIVNAEYRLVGGRCQIFVDNILQAYFTTREWSGTTTSTFFGAIDGTPTNNDSLSSLNGIIYEIIVINRSLTDTERRNIYNLLCVKWNITQ